MRISGIFLIITERSLTMHSSTWFLKNTAGRLYVSSCILAWLLAASWAPVSLASETPAGTMPPPSADPHGNLQGPGTSMPSGIVGLALHITAKRIGDPAQFIIRAVHPT